MTRRRLCGLGAAVLAIVSGAGVASADEAVKLDVQSGAKTVTAGNTVTSEVTLKNAAGAPAPATKAVDVNVELVGPAGKKQSQGVHFDTGQTRATVKWQMEVPGIAHVRAFDVQKGLLDDSEALYVKPKIAPAPPAPAAPADAAGPPVGARKPQPKKKPAKAPRVHPSTPEPRGEADGPTSRFAVLLTQNTLSPPARTPAAPADDAAGAGATNGGLLLDVSARETLGLIANGSDAATVSVFYTGAGGAPTDIQVYLHWECGELSAHPVVVPKGGDHAEVRWTSHGPCEGMLQLISSSPALPVVDSSHVSKVRFVRDVDLQVNPLATFSPLDQPRIVANLVDRSSGAVIASEVARTVTFASSNPAFDVAPETASIAVGASEAATVLTPRAFFSRAFIQLATPGVPPKPLPVRLSSLWLLLVTAFFALLGSLLRYLHRRTEPLETFLMGIAASVAVVAVYLLSVVRIFSSPFLHSMLSVPFLALAAGYIGQPILDSTLKLAGLRSTPDKPGDGDTPTGTTTGSAPPRPADSGPPASAAAGSGK